MPGRESCEKMPEEGVYLVRLSYLLLYFFVEIMLGDIAGNIVGRKLFWILMFISCPSFPGCFSGCSIIISLKSDRK